MSSSSDAAPARTRPGPLAWLLLALSYALFLACVLAPLGLGLLGVGLVLLWAGAAYAALHSGGLALSLGWFDGLSLMALAGALVLLVFGARRWSRERTLGPGGRVINVTVGNGWRGPRLPPRFHLLLPASLLLVVYLGEWVGNPWLPDPLSLALLLLALYAYSAGFVLGVLRGLFAAARGLWRFAGRSGPRALVCAALFIAAVVVAVGEGPEQGTALARRGRGCCSATRRTGPRSRWRTSTSNCGPTSKARRRAAWTAWPPSVATTASSPPGSMRCS